jgi:hypothetical protein
MKTTLFGQTLALCCVLGFTPALQAQTGGLPPLPPGPLIQSRAPDFAEWVITKKTGSLDDTASNSNTAPATPGAAGASPSTQDTVTKTHDVIRVVRVDTAKRPWTIWCQGAQEYMIWPDGKSCGQITAGLTDFSPNPFFIDLSSSDFSGFGWISPKMYSGIKTYHGTKCIVFQAGAHDSGESPTTSKKIAYVDFNSRLPMALQSGGEEYLYEWHPTPRGMLSYPSMVKALIDADVKAQRQMSQKAVSAY